MTETREDDTLATIRVLMKSREGMKDDVPIWSDKAMRAALAAAEPGLGVERLLREAALALVGDWDNIGKRAALADAALLAAAEPALDDDCVQALMATRGALVTVAQWDSWASEWLAKHPARLREDVP